MAGGGERREGGRESGRRRGGGGRDWLLPPLPSLFPPPLCVCVRERGREEHISAEGRGREREMGEDFAVLRLASPLFLFPLTQTRILDHRQGGERERERGMRTG